MNKRICICISLVLALFTTGARAAEKTLSKTVILNDAKGARTGTATGKGGGK